MGKRKELKRICQKMSKALTGLSIDFHFSSFGFAYDFCNDKIILDKNFLVNLVTSNERIVSKIYHNMGITVNHPLTYTLLHELGHLLSREETEFTNEDFEEYNKDSALLNTLVSNGELNWEDSMRLYYTNKIEKAANDIALKLFQTFPKVIAKYDRKFCHFMPI